MPFRFMCKGCGAVLNEVDSLHIVVYQSTKKSRNPHLSPIEMYVRNKIGSHCPKCGRKLSQKPLEVTVEVLDGKKHDL